MATRVSSCRKQELRMLAQMLSGQKNEQMARALGIDGKYVGVLICNVHKRIGMPAFKGMPEKERIQVRRAALRAVYRKYLEAVCV
ncbi:MAG: hypothetical protein V4681_01435 [Patescibacteria group bacterium]